MEKAYITKTDIQHRFGVGVNKAGDIMRDIRRVCNGGKLGAGKVLPAELEYWESLVDKQYKERL